MSHGSPRCSLPSPSGPLAAKGRARPLLAGAASGLLVATRPSAAFCASPFAVTAVRNGEPNAHRPRRGAVPVVAFVIGNGSHRARGSRRPRPRTMRSLTPLLVVFATASVRGWGVGSSTATSSRASRTRLRIRRRLSARRCVRFKMHLADAGQPRAVRSGAAYALTRSLSNERAGSSALGRVGTGVRLRAVLISTATTRGAARASTRTVLPLEHVLLAWALRGSGFTVRRTARAPRVRLAHELRPALADAKEAGPCSSRPCSNITE